MSLVRHGNYSKNEKRLSQKLWLPQGIGCADSHSTLSNTFSQTFKKKIVVLYADSTHLQKLFCTARSGF